MTDSLTPEQRFTIVWRGASYYVSIPNYHGGEVVDAKSFDAQARRIAELERSEREAIEEAAKWARAARKSDDAIGDAHRLLADAGIAPGHIVERVKLIIERAEHYKQRASEPTAPPNDCSECGFKGGRHDRECSRRAPEPERRLLQDRADDLIRELQRQGMETIRIEFMGKLLTVSPHHEPEASRAYLKGQLEAYAKAMTECTKTERRDSGGVGARDCFEIRRAIDALHLHVLHSLSAETNESSDPLGDGIPIDKRQHAETVASHQEYQQGAVSVLKARIDPHATEETGNDRPAAPISVGDSCPVCASGRVGNGSNNLRCANCGWLGKPLETK